MTRIAVRALGGLAVAGVLALPAVAGVHPNDRAGMLGVGAVSAATGSNGTAVTQSGRPDGREAPDGVDVPRVQPTLVLAGDSFDWSDAGIGLAGGVGLALVLVGGLATAQHTRRVAGPS